MRESLASSHTARYRTSQETFTMPLATAADMPPEIIRRVVDLIPADQYDSRKRGLATCGATCRYWASLIRPTLFGQLHLCRTSDVLQLLEILESSFASPAPTPIPPLPRCISSVSVTLALDGASMAPWVQLHKLSVRLQQRIDRLVFRTFDERGLFSGLPRTLPLSLSELASEIRIEDLRFPSAAALSPFIRRLTRYTPNQFSSLVIRARVDNPDDLDCREWVEIRSAPVGHSHSFEFGGPSPMDQNKLEARFDHGRSLLMMLSPSAVCGDSTAWRTLARIVSSLMPEALKTSSCIVTCTHNEQFRDHLRESRGSSVLFNWRSSTIQSGQISSSSRLHAFCWRSPSFRWDLHSKTPTSLLNSQEPYDTSPLFISLCPARQTVKIPYR